MRHNYRHERHHTKEIVFRCKTSLSIDNRAAHQIDVLPLNEKRPLFKILNYRESSHIEDTDVRSLNSQSIHSVDTGYAQAVMMRNLIGA